MANLVELQKKIKYQFKDISLLEHALVHKSATVDDHNKSNERLEFLGDAVLQLCVSTYFFDKYDQMVEGKMAKTRASLVCQPTLADLAKKIDLGSYLKLGKGEILSKGGSKPSILSDAFEAVLGAVFLDGGYEKSYDVIIALFAPIFNDHVEGNGNIDYKTRLQELLQVNGNTSIEYRLVGQEGMPHDMNFTISVYNNGSMIGEGTGKSKKIAEQCAAQAALEQLLK